MKTIINTPDIRIPNTWKRYIISGLLFLLVCEILVGFLVGSNYIQGIQLGKIIFPLFIISQIPTLISFFLVLIIKFNIFSNFKMISTQSITKFYPFLLIFHSFLFTLVVGFVIVHMLLLVNKWSYCVILLISIALPLLIESILYLDNWPLYPQNGDKKVLLYWSYWMVLFGLMIGLPFHAKVWSIFWVIFTPMFTFIPLILLVGYDIIKLRK